jgi:hypothetical protein
MPSESRLVVIATHGHCFDGASSAALFSRFLSLNQHPSTAFSYLACCYGPGSNGVNPELFKGSVNALLDFRYSQCDSITWYFDHHLTAFPAAGDFEHFRARPPKTAFHDASYGSCTKLIADRLLEHFGFHEPSLDNLVYWANIIDSAGFSSAEEAVRRDLPALRLATVLERDGNQSLLQRVVPLIASRPLAEIAAEKSIDRRWKMLAKEQDAYLLRIRDRCQLLGSVVFADLTNEVSEIIVKFVTYALFPECCYSVIVSRGHSKCKISVGYNPWAPLPRRHDISALCARHGGGGHAVVGAVALPQDAVENARALALSIARELAD